MTIHLKRVYEPYAAQDGFRVLVDRLWPRGLSKERAHVDLWLRKVAPSDELRRWFAHDVGKWQGFQERYRTELEEHADLLDSLRALEREHEVVTLLFAARDAEHNQATVLRDVVSAGGGRRVGPQEIESPAMGLPPLVSGHAARFGA